MFSTTKDWVAAGRTSCSLFMMDFPWRPEPGAGPAERTGLDLLRGTRVDPSGGLALLGAALPEMADESGMAAQWAIAPAISDQPASIAAAMHS